MSSRFESGQLLLPMLAALFLFGSFWVAYVLWCRTVYWKMRMDVAADMTALSAARQQATALNYVATIQTLENPFIPEVKGYGIMDVSMRSDFEGWNQVLRTYKGTYKPSVIRVAKKVAAANGSNRRIRAASGTTWSQNTDPLLNPHQVTVLYVASGWPVGKRTYKEAYYTRAWSEDKTKAQPPHKCGWRVCRGPVCEEGWAGLWLDVDPGDLMNDGGFPSAKASLLRSVGIQCFYPQFNARLLPKEYGREWSSFD